MPTIQDARRIWKQVHDESHGDRPQLEPLPVGFLQKPFSPCGWCVEAKLYAGESLAGADLSGVNLGSNAFKLTRSGPGANLRNADLRNARLDQANVSCADLRGANLSHADLRDSDMRGADLTNAGLRNLDKLSAKSPC